MKVVQINATCGKGSTGMICQQISKRLTDAGVENYVLYSGEQSDWQQSISYASRQEIKVQALRSRLSGRYGFVSEKMTERLIAELRRLQPDIVHLHNLHSHNVNLSMLLAYLRDSGVKVMWTFHDCWAFTAYCPHFVTAGCDRWRSGCHNCPQVRRFSFFRDESAFLYSEKKRLMEGLDLTIVPPSEWMAEQVRASFLSSHPIHVIHNGIDCSVFCPTASDFRKKNGISSAQHILLGVAFDWSDRKGLDVFCELAARLPASDYRVVLVGTMEAVEKRLPKQILAVRRTQNQKELAAIYSAADVFVNPTREDTFPTVHLEALACGTPIVTFRTGGCPESVSDRTGIVVEQNNVDDMERAIRRICEERPFAAEDCVQSAQRFDRNQIYQQYLTLYRQLCKDEEKG